MTHGVGLTAASEGGLYKSKPPRQSGAVAKFKAVERDYAAPARRCGVPEVSASRRARCWQVASTRERTQ